MEYSKQRTLRRFRAQTDTQVQDNKMTIDAEELYRQDSHIAVIYD